MRKKHMVKENEEIMVKTVLKVDGMMCGMCESHMNDLIRNQFSVKKVKSSHKKGQTEIVSQDPLDEKKLEEAVASIGYQVMRVTTEPYKKFSFFGK